MNVTARSRGDDRHVITYRGRSAAREVGNALGFEPDQLARLASLVGHWSGAASTTQWLITSRRQASIFAIHASPLS